MTGPAGAAPLLLRLLLPALLLGAAVSPEARVEAAAQPRSECIACVVHTVNDGDTLRCADGRRVRLLQIDAPERDLKPLGPAARASLLRLAPPGITVQLETDVRRQDQYGRTLAFVWLPDGRMANQVLAREGSVLMLVYAPNHKHLALLRSAVDSARQEKRGVWAPGALTCEPRRHRQHVC